MLVFLCAILLISTIEKLDLKAPIYSLTAVGGHFGKDSFAWEQLDKAEELKDAILPRKTDRK